MARAKGQKPKPAGGRPASGQAKTKVLHIRVQDVEQTRLQKVADAHYLELSTWARSALLRLADDLEPGGFTLPVRFSEAEWKALKDTIEREGDKVSDWARRTLLSAAGVSGEVAD
jgi:hypothetical protein